MLYIVISAGTSVAYMLEGGRKNKGRFKDRSLIMGNGGLQNVKITGQKLFHSPHACKTFSHPLCFKGVETLCTPIPV